VDTYPDIMADALKKAGRPLSFGDLYQRVHAVRTIERSSFTLFLSEHPRFYKSAEGTYGLRAWLPSREKQTLLTPTWQVETPDSYRRVARASDRGYDIHNMIERDKVEQP